MQSEKIEPKALEMIIRKGSQGLPDWLERKTLVDFLHFNMKPYEDRIADIEKALDYCMNHEKGKGGFLILVRKDEELAGALVVLHTGMSGYIPEHIILFVSVRPDLRGHGIGSRMVDAALDRCPGEVKLHVDFDNPAKHLYERKGFIAKYTEMRYLK